MKYTTPEDHLKRLTHPEHRDSPAHRQSHIRPISEALHVITVIHNPMRFRTRYDLYHAFAEHCEDAGAILYTVELAQRDRHFEVTDPNNPRHFQFRTPSLVWFKENLVNLAIQRLPGDWRYVAWIDADIQFANPQWANEILHELQLHQVVQCWSHAMDLTHDFQPTPKMFKSYMYSYVNGIPHPFHDNPGHQFFGQHGNKGHHGKHGHGKHGHHNHGHHTGQGHGSGNPHYMGASDHHSGFAWAARRSAIADLGGLGEVAPLGSADHHIAAALVGKVKHTIHQGMQLSFKTYWDEYQHRAQKYIKRNVGFVPGLITHYHHGPKANRLYNDRWKILVDEKFDYLKDLKKDPQGLWQLTDRNHKLRDKLVAYFRQRNEDDPCTE
jgi:hypothetical protein